MKKYFILLITVLATTAATGQSLKDSLFKGKLKNPLSQSVPPKDSARSETAKDNLKIDSAVSVTNPADPAAPVAEVKPDDTMPDSLNKLYYARQKTWDRFVKSQTLLITQEADESRKVKKGEYYIEIEYEIGVNGRVKPINITCNPKNEFLAEKLTEMMSRPPVLAAPVYGDGKPRPIQKKQEITILKK